MLQIDHDRCTGCGACVEACPSEAIAIQDGFAQVIQERCTECGSCAEVCPQGAVLLLPEASSQEIVKSGGQPEDRLPEVITVRVPPPPALIPPRPAPARQLRLALGAALSFLGREVAPQLLRLAANWMEEQIHAPQVASSGDVRRQSTPRGGTHPRSAQGGGGKRRRRQRRGR